MKNPFGRLCAAALLCASLAAHARAQEPAPRPAPTDAELPNFVRVGEHLYRGGQPAGDGFRRLAALGIRTVVNLRAADERAREEERAAREAGLQYFNVPLPVYARPRDEQVERVLALIDAPENRPVFVHCRRGSDRTGTVVAAYRISREGWTGADALREAAGRGLHRAQFEMRGYIDDYYRRRAGLEDGGDLGTDLAATASEATRRTLGKSYAITRARLRRLKRVFR